MTAADLAVAPLDARAYEALAREGFGADVFNPTQHEAGELIERYATALAIDLCRTLGLSESLGTGATAERVRAAQGWTPAITPALAWLLERLAQAGHLERAGAGYRSSAPLPDSVAAALRARALAVDATFGPGYDLLDEAAAAFPAIARDETTGERALLGKLALWIRYFDNQNGAYALNNRVAARVAARHVPAGAHVLEVGAGLGSASEALLDALAAAGTLARVATYRATEPVAFFARRAQRVLTGRFPGVPCTFAPLDVNEPWEAQGVPPGSQQLVWGVNVFHLARDLDDVLRRAREALAPGGALVVGEGMRPADDAVVGAEFPFRLLESFTAVTCDPATRPTPGFLTAERWMAALERAGFRNVAVAPDVRALRTYHAGMVAAAVVGVTTAPGPGRSN